MADFKKPSEGKDYKERFEFVLTTTNSQTGDANIICQRYFKIGNFNPLCTMSSRLKDSVVRCAKIINKDLIEKSRIYLELAAPRVFETEEEMETYFANPMNRVGMVPGEGIVIRKPESPNYVWSNKGPKLCPTKFNKTEFTHNLTDEDVTVFTFTFKDNGRAVCTYSWEAILPKAVKYAIDLSNKFGKVEPSEVSTLGGEASIYYKMTEGRSDLVWKIIKELCAECCVKDDDYYKNANPFGEELTIQESIIGY